MDQLNNLRAVLGLNKKKLQGDSKTRFDTSLLMLKSIFDIKTAIHEVQSGTDSDWPSELFLTPDEFLMIDVLVKV